MVSRCCRLLICRRALLYCRPLICRRALPYCRPLICLRALPYCRQRKTQRKRRRCFHLVIACRHRSRSRRTTTACSTRSHPWATLSRPTRRFCRFPPHLSHRRRRHHRRHTRARPTRSTLRSPSRMTPWPWASAPSLPLRCCAAPFWS